MLLFVKFSGFAVKPLSFNDNDFHVCMKQNLFSEFNFCFQVLRTILQNGISEALHMNSKYSD